MTKIELSTIEEFLSIAKDCKELSVYEYYDGFHCTIDSKEYLLIERPNDPTFSFYEYEQIIFSSVYLFKNLNNFGYTTRFRSDMDYSNLKISELNLKKLELTHLHGIECLNQIEDLTLEYLSISSSDEILCSQESPLTPDESGQDLIRPTKSDFDIIKNCKTLKKIYVNLLYIYPSKHQDFITYLTNNNIEYEFDDIDGAD
jgi:hypothetical protein